MAGKNNRIKVIFCTGRSISQCAELFDNPLVPKPDIWICDIGCSIYQDDLSPLKSVHDGISQRWSEVGNVFDAIPNLKDWECQRVDFVNRISFQCLPHEFSEKVENCRSRLKLRC